MEINQTDEKESDLLNFEENVENENIERLTEEKNKPLDQRLFSSMWKVRKEAYIDFYNILKKTKNSELLEKIPIVKFMDDASPGSLESALDCLIFIFREMSNFIKEDIRCEIFQFSIEKAYACSKTPVKLKSKELICTILETSDNIAKLFEILKKIITFSLKKMKTVIFGEQILSYLILEYGCKNFDYKFFLPPLIKLINDGNTGVRYAAYEIMKEIYRQIKGDLLLLPELVVLKQSYVKDLKNEFDKIEENGQETVTNLIPNRNFTLGRSPVSNISSTSPVAFAVTPTETKIKLDQEIEVEEYYTTPVQSSLRNSLTAFPAIKSTTYLVDKFPEEWVNKLLSKERKWIEKKEILEEFTNIITSHKICDVIDVKLEYLFSCFKILLKDSNINVVQSTLNAITSLSLQLGKDFSPFTKEYLPLILEKFKEKKDKLNKEIIITLSTFLKCNLDLSEMIPLLEKVPSDKSNQFKLNICEFLLISMRKTYKNLLRKVFRNLLSILIKLSDEQNIDIRNTAFNCLALLKLRLKDEFQNENLLNEVNEIKKLKIDELSKTINYDKLYDVEQIIESPKIKINRRKDSSGGVNANAQNEEMSPVVLLPTHKQAEDYTPAATLTQFSLRDSFSNNYHTVQNSIPSKNVINIDDIPLAPTRVGGGNPSEVKDDEIYPKKKQSDLDEFERKLEEEMKKEEERRQEINSNNSIINRTVIKKAVGSKNIEEDEDTKLNKNEIEDKINSYLGDEIAILLQSQKWDEKKTGLIKFNEWISGNISKNYNLISQNLENLLVFLKVKLKDFKEVNFIVIRESINIYIILIREFSGKGYDKKFSINIIKGLSDKMGDPKLKENISNLFFEMMENQGPKFILSNLLKVITNEKKPLGIPALKEYSSLFEKAIDDFTINFIPVKDLVEFCKYLANHTNPQLRNSSISLLCVLYKYIGKEIKFLLKDIKESTMKIIDGEFEKITVESIPNKPKRELKPNALKEEGVVIANTNANGNASKNKNSANAGVNGNPLSISIIDSLITRADISKKVTTKMLKDINDGKWPEKKEACETLEKILNDASMKVLPNGLAELFGTIKSRLSDGNKNVVRLIVHLLTKLIEAVGGGFKTFTKMISTPLINNLSDKMQMLREDVLICMEKWVAQCGLETIIIYIPTFLKQDNFEMRTELFKFLNKFRELFVFVKDKFDLKEFVSPLLLCLQDKSLNIRASAEELIAYTLRFTSLSNYINGLKDFKPAIANPLKLILEKYNNINNIQDDNFEMMASPSITLKDKKINTNIAGINPNLTLTPTEKNSYKGESTISKGNSQKKIKVDVSPSSTSSKFDQNTPGKNSKNTSKKTLTKEDDLSANSITMKCSSTVLSSNKNLMSTITPRIIVNKKVINAIFVNNPFVKLTKEKRMEIDKKYKFNLETLNEDFVNKLKDSLKSIFTNEFILKMFHDELKNYLEAINIIHLQMREYENMINFNIYDYLDLILKWLGWKCNNNQNPSLVKSLLEFLETLNGIITEKEIELNDTEGYVIIALLIDKLAVNNTKIKETARTLLEKYLDKISQRFSHLVYISAAKISKVKIECIEICTNLIISSGASITSYKDLKFLAKMLSTNDNQLKNSLINFFSQVYIQLKENLWTALNDTPDKLKEMLYNNFISSGLIHDEQDEEEEKEEAPEEREENSKGKLGLPPLSQSQSHSQNNNMNTTITSNLKVNNINSNKLTNTTATASAPATATASAPATATATAPALTPPLKLQDSKKKLIIPKAASTGSAELTGLSAAENRNTTPNPNNSVYQFDKENMNSNSSTYSNLSSVTVTDSESLKQILSNLNNGEISERVNIILVIHDLVYVKFAQSKNILIPNIDSIIKAFVLSLKTLFENKNLNEIPIKMGKYLLTVLYKISSNKELIKNISYEMLFELSEEVLSNLLIENLDKVGDNQEGVVIIRSLNSTMLRVLENCDYTNVIAVLLELVKKYRRNEVKMKISGLAIKCLLKINQILAQIVDSINISKILVKIHELLINFEESNPELNPSNQTDQMVIRYIKNLINELVKLRKENIISDYSKGVEKNPKKDNYLKKWIKSILGSINENKLNSSVLSNEGSSIENLIAYKNKLQQNNKFSRSPDAESSINRNNLNSNTNQNITQSIINSNSNSNSPIKRPRNSEMYNKIMGLKSKLAHYSNTTINLNNSRVEEENIALSQTFIRSPDSTNDNLTSTGKPIMSKINELKKKWNDVSSKNKNISNLSISPDGASKNLEDSNSLTTDRMSDVKSRYSITKSKNVNTGSKK